MTWDFRGEEGELWCGSVTGNNYVSYPVQAMVSSDCQSMPTSFLNHYFFCCILVCQEVPRDGCFTLSIWSRCDPWASSLTIYWWDVFSVVFSVQGCIKQLGPITTVPSGPLNLLPRLVPEYAVAWIEEVSQWSVCWRSNLALIKVATSRLQIQILRFRKANC